MIDFFKLRPSAPTAAATAEALERARAAQNDAGRRIDELRAARDKLLLDGDAAQLTKAEAALESARGDVERTAAVVAQLEERQATAVRAETIGKVDTAAKALETADADLRRWWEKNETALRRILGEGHRLSLAVTAAMRDVGWQERMARQAYPDAALAELHQAPRDHRDWPETIARLIEHGVSMPRQASPGGANEVVDGTPSVATGPGALTQGIPAAQGGGTLASTYVGKASREDAA